MKLKNIVLSVVGVVLLSLMNFNEVISDNESELKNTESLLSLALANNTANESDGDTSSWIQKRDNRYNKEAQCYYPCVDESDSNCSAANTNAC